MFPQDPKECPVCKCQEPKGIEVRDGGQRVSLDCPRCGGRFTITHIAVNTARMDGVAFKLCAWLRDCFERGLAVPEIDRKTFKDIEAMFPRYSLSEKQEQLLRACLRRTGSPGHPVFLVSHLDYPLAWAQDEKEFNFLVHSLIENKWIHRTNGPEDAGSIEADWAFMIVVTQQGWAIAEDRQNGTEFMRMAIAEARKCRAEDGRIHPMVGAVVVKDGKLLGTAYRGELTPGEHAEFTVLEKKLGNQIVAGSTVYTTLEPCTSRNNPKIPCADRLIERRVAKVVIGILDPDDRIRGKGQMRLRDAGITTELFPPDLMAEVEDINRAFIREKKNKPRLKSTTGTGERHDSGVS